MRWDEKIIEFCRKYNIPIDYLAETLYEPKVIPMIRGKAFEFSVLLALHDAIPASEFEVTKIPMNAQLGSHDEDVSIKHLASGIKLSVECKLSAKASYRSFTDGSSQIKVKCMRSRTLGRSVIERLSPVWNIPQDVISVHSDQYLPTDFDFVVTSIGNAFYITNSDTGLFEWGPSESAKRFLQSIHLKSEENRDLKDFAFHKLYIARTSNLAVRPENNVMCTRQKCKTPENCNFVPNYPIIRFQFNRTTPDYPWFELKDSLPLFYEAIKAKS